MIAKFLTVVLGASIAAFAPKAQAAPASDYYIEATKKIAQCSSFFPIHSLVQATSGESISRKQKKQLRNFLATGKLSSQSLDAGPKLTKECSEFVTGLIFEKTLDYSRQLNTPIHPQIATNRAVCASQYHYAGTIQALFQDADTPKNKTAVAEFLASGQVSPTSANSHNLEQTQSCSNLVNGSFAAVLSQAFFGKTAPENDIIRSVNQVADASVGTSLAEASKTQVAH